DDIADVIAETFTAAWRRLPEAPPGHEARLWLYGTARRVLADHHPPQERRSALAARLRHEAATWAASDTHHTGDAGPQAFRRLSSEDRVLLARVGWEGRTIAGVATVLGTSRGAAPLRLQRARKRLARELAAAARDLATYGGRAVALAEGQR